MTPKLNPRSNLWRSIKTYVSRAGAPSWSAAPTVSKVEKLSRSSGLREQQTQDLDSRIRTNGRTMLVRVAPLLPRKCQILAPAITAKPSLIAVSADLVVIPLRITMITARSPAPSQTLLQDSADHGGKKSKNISCVAVVSVPNVVRMVTEKNNKGKAENKVKCSCLPTAQS